VVVPLLSGECVVLPVSLEVTTSFVAHEQGRWFEGELAFAAEHVVERGWLVLDIGASFGLYTLALSASVGPAGRVSAFEPSPCSAALLRQTLQLNGATNVELVEVALSDKDGTARLVSPGTPELGLLQEVAGDGPRALPGADVATITLDAFGSQSGMEMAAVRFVKMDVEGCEAKVLAGGRSLFDAHSPIVLFEVNNAGQWNAEVVDAFKERGYGCYRLLPGLNVLVPVRPDDMDAYLLNLFALKPQQADELAARGLLLRQPAGPTPAGEELAAAHRDARLALFEGAGYCRGYVEVWSTGNEGDAATSSEQEGAAPECCAPTPAKGMGRAAAGTPRGEGEVALFLDLWAVAKDASSTPAVRWHSLQASWAAISALASDPDNCPCGRLLTYPRQFFYVVLPPVRSQRVCGEQVRSSML